MSPAPNPFKTRIYTAPKGMEGECGSLEVLETNNMLISCWEPSEAEIEALKAGEKVWLYLVANVQPPVALSVGNRPL